MSTVIVQMKKYNIYIESVLLLNYKTLDIKSIRCIEIGFTCAFLIQHIFYIFVCTFVFVWYLEMTKSTRQKTKKIRVQTVFENRPVTCHIT